MTITMTTQSRMFFVKSFKGLPSFGMQPGPGIADHATPSENRSPAGMAQNRGHFGVSFGKAEFVERLDEACAIWFQGTVAESRPLFGLRGACNLYNALMELSERQRKYLRGLGHALNPIILIGTAGVTPAVVAETLRALSDHELIKVKFRGADRGIRDAGLGELATATESTMVQRIGHTALYYKRRIDRPGIVIPDA